MAGGPAAFVSYCRQDSAFALRLVEDVRRHGANIWLDQIDIVPGERWDGAIEEALRTCTRVLVVLSPASVASTNVMDEVSFALEEGKRIIPIVHQDCAVPFRLRRLQYLDFRKDYKRGLQDLLKVLDTTPVQPVSAPPPVQMASGSPADAVEATVATRTGQEEYREPLDPSNAAAVEHGDLVSQAPAENDLSQSDALPEQGPVERQSSTGDGGAARQVHTPGQDGSLDDRDPSIAGDVPDASDAAELDTPGVALGGYTQSPTREFPVNRIPAIVFIVLLVAAGIVWMVTQRAVAQRAAERAALNAWLTTSPPNPHLSAGWDLVRAGDLDGAIVEFRKVPPTDRDGYQARQLLGSVLKKKGDADGMIALYRELIKEVPGDYGVSEDLRFALMNKNEIEEVYTLSQAAVERWPEDANAHITFAWALQRKGELERAEAEWRKVIALTPQYAPAHYNVAIIRLDQQDRKGALEHLRVASQLDPKNPDIRAALNRVAGTRR